MLNFIYNTMKNELKQLRKETLMHGIEILFLVHVLH